MEPALYTFDPPRTIAATLTEYERHLGATAGDCAGSVQLAVDQLRDLLDPIEAPLVTLTAGVARTLVATAVREWGLSPGGMRRSLLAPIETACRFFGWAKERGYVGKNPFESLMLAATPRSTAGFPGVAVTAARGWVA